MIFIYVKLTVYYEVEVMPFEQKRDHTKCLHIIFQHRPEMSLTENNMHIYIKQAGF